MSNTYIDCFKLASQVFNLIVKDPVLYGAIYRLVNNVDEIDEESLQKYAISCVIETISAAYLRTKEDERSGIPLVGDELNILKTLVDALIPLGVELPKVEAFKPGTTEFSIIFNYHLKGNGIEVGTNRGDDQPLKVYLKPGFTGLGDK
jgi:hypothetical protein